MVRCRTVKSFFRPLFGKKKYSVQTEDAVPLPAGVIDKQVAVPDGNEIAPGKAEISYHEGDDLSTHSHNGASGSAKVDKLEDDDLSTYSFE